MLGKGGIGVGFFDNRAGLGLYLEFVFVKFLYSGDKKLPNPGAAQNSHGAAAAVPAVEAADDADALGVGRPDGEKNAGNVVNIS